MMVKYVSKGKADETIEASEEKENETKPVRPFGELDERHGKEAAEASGFHFAFGLP